MSDHRPHLVPSVEEQRVRDTYAGTIIACTFLVCVTAVVCSLLLR